MQSFKPEKIREFSASIWFYYKEICYDAARSHVTMHGHMNVKYPYICFSKILQYSVARTILIKIRYFIAVTGRGPGDDQVV